VAKTNIGRAGDFYTSDEEDEFVGQQAKLPRKNSNCSVKTISLGRHGQRYPCTYLNCDKDFSHEIDHSCHENLLWPNPSNYKVGRKQIRLHYVTKCVTFRDRPSFHI
jgi:hypothetical protein